MTSHPFGCDTHLEFIASAGSLYRSQSSSVLEPILPFRIHPAIEKCYALRWMPVLKVSNGYTQNLLGLGKLQDFRTLSQRRITDCVRDTLGRKYGRTLVKVPRSVTFEGSEWSGRCVVWGQSLTYRVSPD